MSNLPSNRTKLQAAISNQQPSIVASSKANREAMVEAYDTIDLLNQKVDNLVPVGAVTPAPPAFLSRQAIINGNFDVWQRGTIFTNPVFSGSYTADRWKFAYANAGTWPTTIIHSKQTLTPGDIPGSVFFYRINTNGSGSGFGVNDAYGIQQPVEFGTRYLCGAGKKVTVSFWAKSDIPGKKLGCHVAQIYGTGGSPSATEQLVGQIVNLTSNWAKYTITFNTNTLVGKTFGTNNDDYLNFIFNILFGSTYASSRYGQSVSESFVGAGNIDIAQVQVNTGDTALPFQPRSVAEENELCQRYFESIGTGAFGQVVTATNVQFGYAFKAVKRVVPTLVSGGAQSIVEIGAGSKSSSASTFVSTLADLRGVFAEINGFAGLTAGNRVILTSNAISVDAEI